VYSCDNCGIDCNEPIIIYLSVGVQHGGHRSEPIVDHIELCAEHAGKAIMELLKALNDEQRRAFVRQWKHDK